MSTLKSSAELRQSPSLPKCLYCGTQAYTLTWSGIRDRLQFVEGEWSYYRCGGCGTQTLEPFPTEGDLAAFYPEVYTFAPDAGDISGWRGWLARAEFALYYRPQNRAQVNIVLQKVLPPAGSCRLLDVGCGKGLRLVEFRRRGIDPHGVDFQPQSVAYLKQRHDIPAVASHLYNFADNFQEKSFDVITAFYVLEHVREPVRVLKDAYRLLKPGGWFVGALPLSDSWQTRLFGKNWCAVTEAPRHLSLPTVRGCEQMFRDAGYTDVFTVPDSIWACAGTFGLSLVEKGSTTHLYGSKKISPLLTRLLAAVVTLFAFPICWFENVILRRPTLGLTFGRRP